MDSSPAFSKLMNISIIAKEVQKRAKRDAIFWNDVFGVAVVEETLESFSSEDGDGNENVISKYSFLFQHLFHDYWNLFNLENADELSRN